MKTHKIKIKKGRFTIRLAFLLFVAFSLTMLSSCERQLTEEPINFYSASEFFKSTDNLEKAVNGVYEVFSDQKTYGQPWMVYDCDTDISHIAGSGTGHVARDLGHYNIFVTDAWIQNSWALYYTGIDRANTILAYADNVEIQDDADQKVFNTLIAETKALRAMCYFDLVILFGDVPFTTTPTESDEFGLTRTDRNVIFDQIEKDYQEAIAHLEYTVDKSSTFDGRLNKGAVMGLLIRMNMFRAGYFLGQDGNMQRYPNYKEYYQKAITLADELINSGKHRLLDSYERVFRNMCELIIDPTENMWEIPFFNATGQRTHSGMMGTYNGPAININSKYGRANSFIKTTGFFYDTFAEDDPRRDVAVATFSINESDQVRQIARNQSYNWAPGKWRRNWQTGPVKDNNNTDVNWLFIRYADVLLYRAEAENEINGVTPAAVEYLNQIRRRAYGFPYKASNDSIDKTLADFASPDDFRKEIVDERARELCFEGLRRQDLIRWNLLDAKIKETDAKFKDAIAEGSLRNYIFRAAELFTHNKHELYPIPDYEIRESKGLLKQNPGYQTIE